jgi:hypothetical protein
MGRGLTILLVLAAAARADEVDDAVKVLVKARSFDGKYTGEGGDLSKTYRAYERLAAAASLDRLLTLTDHPNAIVRCYAVEAIAERHPPDRLDGIVASHIDDMAKVLAFFGGCCGAETVAGDVMIEVTRDRLTPARRAAIRKHLLATTTRRDSLDWALRNETFEPELHDQVRALAAGGDGSALIALARYRREGDLPLILAALGRKDAREGDLWNAQLAAAEYPHPKLRPVVSGTPKEQRTSAWYAAVAAYGDGEAAALLDAAWRDGGDARALFEALRDHRADAFAPLLVRLWLESRELDGEALAFLFSRDPQGTLDRIERQLRENVDKAPYDGLAPMLDLLGRERPDRLEPAIAAGLKGRDASAIHVLARKAAELKREAFVEPLFRLFEGNAPYWSRFYAAQAILCYGTPELDRRLAEALERAEGIGEGQPRERLRQLVREKPRAFTDDD